MGRGGVSGTAVKIEEYQLTFAVKLFKIVYCTSDFICLNQKNCDGDSKALQKGKAKQGGWEPAASRKALNITPELQAERDTFPECVSLLS